MKRIILESNSQVNTDGETKFEIIFNFKNFVYKISKKTVYDDIDEKYYHYFNLVRHNLNNIKTTLINGKKFSVREYSFVPNVSDEEIEYLYNLIMDENSSDDGIMLYLELLLGGE